MLCPTFGVMHASTHAIDYGGITQQESFRWPLISAQPDTHAPFLPFKSIIEGFWRKPE